MDNDLITILKDLSNIENSKLDNGQINTFKEKLSNFYQQNSRHDYHQITKYMVENNQDRLEMLVTNLENIIKSSTIEESLAKNLNKLYDHIRLEEIRMNQIRRINAFYFKDAENNLQRSKEIEKELKKVQNESKNIYVNLITILGIFSAIMVGIFGTLGGIGSVATSLGNEGILLQNAIFIFLGVFILLFDIIFIFFAFILYFYGDKQLSRFHKISFIILNLICFVVIIVMFFLVNQNIS